MTAVFSSVVIFETSFAQNNTVQNSVGNNTLENNTKLSSSLNSDLAIANNNSDAIVDNDYFNDFGLSNDTESWFTQSGNWSYTPDGLHGSSTERLVNNIILSPITLFGNEFIITTLFKINDVNENMTNPASIVYSYIDKQNYDQAGIHISNNDVYLKISRAANNTFEYMPEYPGIKTDLKWDPGNVFNMTLLSQGNSKHILLNGTLYSFDIPETNEGLIGLGYGTVKSIDFLTFKYQKLNNTTIDAVIQNLLPNIATRDSQTILLGEKTLPEDSYIPVYDSTPYQIKGAHLTAKFPCNDSGVSDVDVLIGQAPNLQSAELVFVGPFPPSEELCLYQADVKSDETNHITDIVIQNNSTDDIEFPETSSMIISIEELSKIS
jgi:hypothetical protein